jgi:uncharacterized protein (DUF2225 family)
MQCDCIECGYSLDNFLIKKFESINDCMYKIIICPNCGTELVIEYDEGFDEDGDYYEWWYTEEVEK